MIAASLAAAALASSVLGFPASPASVGMGIQADPVCLAVTAQPGHSYSLGAVYVTETGGSVSLSVAPVTSGPAARLAQVPGSWVTFGSGTVNPGPGLSASASVPVTLNVPAGAAPGPYESSILALAGGAPPSGSGAALGAGAATALVLTVGPSSVPPPPCDALDEAQVTGKFPPWPTEAFATTGWPQVSARGRHDTPPALLSPTASASAAGPGPAAAAPAYSPAAASGHAGPNRDGWVVIALVACIFAVCIFVAGWRRARRSGRKP